MSEIEQVWPAEAFDAISIAAREGQFKIEGIEGNQVRLEGDWGSRYWRDAKLEPVGRWLQIYLWKYPSAGQLTLRLPKNKAWVVELSAGRGEIQAKNVQVRLQAMLGRGEIRVEDCGGKFDLMSGNGMVEAKHCTEIEMPERPPLPEGASLFQTSSRGEDAATPEGFRKERMKDRMKSKRPRDWWSWGEDDWSDWGTQIGEQASVWGMQIAEQAAAWAQQFIQGFGRMGWGMHKGGLNLQVGKGDVILEDVDANACSIGIGKGNAKLERGRIGELVAYAGHGDFKCQAILPLGDWVIKTSHGDIDLSLPADAQAKLDVATRHGDIRSDIPLVRVARPGPEARHGGRMVGTLGQEEGKIADISLVAMSGDIKIDLRRDKSRYTQKSADAGMAASSEARQTTGQASDEKVGVTTPSQPAYDSPLAVLQALSEKRISVEEAERLLRQL